MTAVAHEPATSLIAASNASTDGPVVSQSPRSTEATASISDSSMSCRPYGITISLPFGWVDLQAVAIDRAADHPNGALFARALPLPRSSYWLRWHTIRGAVLVYGALLSAGWGQGGLSTRRRREILTGQATPSCLVRLSSAAFSRRSLASRRCRHYLDSVASPGWISLNTGREQYCSLRTQWLDRDRL